MQLNALVAQFPVTLSVQSNLELIDSILEQAQAGDWVVFPEGAVSGYSTDVSFLKQINPAEVVAGLSHVQKAAEQRRINIWVGACIQQENQWFNNAYGFSADGQTQVYQKINLAHHERGVFAAGSQLPVFTWDTPAGVVRFGVQICRELRFPEQWSWLAQRGAQVIFHLNNAVGDDTHQTVWRSHLISRAAENQRFVLSANNAALKQVSPSIAIAPDGQVLAEMVSDRFGILRVELDLSQVSDWYLEQRRTDVVAVQASRPQTLLDFQSF